MKILQVKTFKSSKLLSVFDNVKTFELDDKAFDSGAFGEVYFCQSLNGKQINTPQVIKILIDDGSGSARAGIKTIQNLQEKIISQNQALKASAQKPIEQIPCLFALPQLSFEGSLNGKTVYGYSQNRVDTSQFILFKDFFDEPDFYKKKKIREGLQKLPIADRLKLGYDLAEGFQGLRDMAYIHADLNPKNLFIRFNPPELILIDYDSGVVVNNQEDKADTFGQMGGWIAPEIQSQLLQNNRGLIKVDLNTDTWAVAVAIHYLLFLFHPLDFLKVRGKNEIKAYFDKKQWPEFDVKDKNFRTELIDIYNKYSQYIKTNMPSNVLKGLKVTINEGYFNPGRRVTYRQWLKILSSTQSTTNNIVKQGAEIISFYSEKIKINLGEKINLIWEVKDAVILKINGKEYPISQKSALIAPASNTTYNLEVTGPDGNIKRGFVNIEVQNKKKAVTNPSGSIGPISFSTNGKPLNLFFQRLFLILILFGIGLSFYLLNTKSIISVEIFTLLSLGLITALFGFYTLSYLQTAAVRQKKRLKEEGRNLNISYQPMEKEIEKLKSKVELAEEKIAKQKRKLGKETLLLKERERIEIEKIKKKFERPIVEAQNKINQAKKTEDEALKIATDKLYEKIIKSELYKYLIIDADIEGIQIIFKGILTFNGIFTAADIVEIDKSGNILKPNGDWVKLNALTTNKVRKLWEWKQKAISDIKRRFPQALTPEQKNQIRQNNLNTFNQLMKEEASLQQNFQNELQNISLKTNQQINNYNAVNIESLMKEKEATEKKLKHVYLAANQKQSELNHFQKKMEVYHSISFRNYLRKIIGL